MKRVIGLMGNSGSGKSTVAAYLESKGAAVIDADQVSRELSEIGKPGLAALRNVFPHIFFNDDGSLDRRRLGQHIFSNPDEKRRLEEVLHPLMKSEIEGRIAKAQDGLVVVDCAILDRMGLLESVDEVWLIMSDMDSKIDRIRARDGITGADAAARLGSQEDETLLTRHADCILRNDGTVGELYIQIEECLDGKG